VSAPINFSDLANGTRLIIQSEVGTIFDLTVRDRTRLQARYLTFLPVVVNDIDGIGEHGFRLGRAATLSTAMFGDVSVEEAAERFKDKTDCAAIHKDYWGCLLQLGGVPAGIFRISAFTILQ